MVTESDQDGIVLMGRCDDARQRLRCRSVDRDGHWGGSRRAGLPDPNSRKSRELCADDLGSGRRSRPCGEHALPIGHTEFGSGRVIRGNGILPVAKPLLQRGEESRCVLRVGRRVERLIQIEKCVGVMQQADLETPDIDTALTFSLRRARRTDRFTAAVELPACAIDIDRPRPGNDAPQGRIPAAAFDPPDCQQQACRHAELLLRGAARLLAIHRGLGLRAPHDTANRNVTGRECQEPSTKSAWHRSAGVELRNAVCATIQLQAAAATRDVQSGCIANIVVGAMLGSRRI
jgi:hypothetical protein